MSKEEINAFLGSGTNYSGKLIFQGAVRIDGIFLGEITSDGTLVVGKDAKIEGKLDVGELILGGSFSGEVRVKRRINVHKTGELIGEVFTPALILEEGGIIEGAVHMQEFKKSK